MECFFPKPILHLHEVDNLENEGGFSGVNILSSLAFDVFIVTCRMLFTVIPVPVPESYSQSFTL